MHIHIKSKRPPDVAFITMHAHRQYTLAYNVLFVHYRLIYTLYDTTHNYLPRIVSLFQGFCFCIPIFHLSIYLCMCVNLATS